jgi:hypothetical protein
VTLAARGDAQAHTVRAKGGATQLAQVCELFARACARERAADGARAARRGGAAPRLRMSFGSADAAE